VQRFFSGINNQKEWHNNCRAEVIIVIPEGCLFHWRICSNVCLSCLDNGQWSLEFVMYPQSMQFVCWSFMARCLTRIKTLCTLQTSKHSLHFLPKNPPNIYFLTAWQYWNFSAKPKNVFRSTLNLCIKLLWNFKKFYLTDFAGRLDSVDWNVDKLDGFDELTPPFNDHLWTKTTC